MDRMEIRRKLQKKLDEKRFEHSLGVEYTAACMAMIFGVDVEKAALAGLLHDCAKYLSSEDKIKKCIKYKLPISKYERKNPELLHAKLSAYYAKEKYGVEDEEVLSAITWHTTGKPNMNTLDKIIYIADYIEPNRKKLMEMDEIRKEAFSDLDQCTIHIVKNTLSYLEKKEACIDDITRDTYLYYIKGEK